MVFTRSLLTLCVLGTMLGTMALPALDQRQPYKNEVRSQQMRYERDLDPPFSLPFPIDWQMLENDVNSLMSEFLATKHPTSTMSPPVVPPTQSPVSSPSPPSSSHSVTPVPSTSTSLRPTSSSTPPTSSSTSHSSSSSSTISSPVAPPTSSTSHSSSSSSTPTLSSSIESTPLSSSTSSTPSSSTPSAAPSPIRSVSTSSPIRSVSTSSASSSSIKPTSQSSTTKSTSTSSASPGVPTPTSQIEPPYFAIYTDESALGFPSASQISGFNIFILAFYLSTGPTDQVASWQQLSASQRASIMADYQADGISMMVSCMGSTDFPTTLDVDPVAFAQAVAAWAIQFEMSGVDVDYEDFPAVGAGTALNWLSTFTTTLRTALPANMVISHAPVAPWMSPQQLYHSLELQVGAAINWYNVQFYSQGSLYTTCDGLLNESGGQFPQSSLFEIIAGGIPKEKVVVGKPAQAIDVEVDALNLDVRLKRSTTTENPPRLPARRAATTTSHSTTSTTSSTTKKSTSAASSTTSHAPSPSPLPPPNTNGFMEPSLLSQCLVTAVANGWNTGVMTWEYPDADAAWIAQVRTPAFPI